MTESEIKVFVKRMSNIGNEWTAEDAERDYGEMSLEDALLVEWLKYCCFEVTCHRG